MEFQFLLYTIKKYVNNMSQLVKTIPPSGDVYRNSLKLVYFLSYSKFFFRQLLCFERQNRGTVEILDAVKEIFRAMMPIFNNENKSIITPLLATGFQVS